MRWLPLVCRRCHGHGRSAAGAGCPACCFCFFWSGSQVGAYSAAVGSSCPGPILRSVRESAGTAAGSSRSPCRVQSTRAAADAAAAASVQVR